MVKKHGFSIQVLDSDGNALREYGYTPKPGEEDDKNVDKSQVYLEVPSPNKDQSFTILIKRTRPSDNFDYFFLGTYDGITSCLGSALRSSEGEIKIESVALADEHKNKYIYHTLRFEKLPTEVTDEDDSDHFGKFQIDFYPESKLEPHPGRVSSYDAIIDQFKSRKRPYSMIDADSTDSSEINTPSTIVSDKRQKLSPYGPAPLCYAKSHSVELGKVRGGISSEDVFTVHQLGKTTYRVVFHYRNRNALRALNILSKSSKEVSPMDGLVLQSAIKKLEKLKDLSGNHNSNSKDSDDGMSDDEGQNDAYSDDEGDDFDADDLCKRLRLMVSRLRG